MKIYKYEIPFQDSFELELPIGYKIINIDTQKFFPVDDIFIWALINPEAELKKVKFTIHTTGEEIRDIETKKYIGTFKLVDIKFVGHLFEVE